MSRHTGVAAWMIGALLAGCGTSAATTMGSGSGPGSSGEEREARKRRAYEGGLALFQRAEVEGFDDNRCEQLEAHFGAIESGGAAYMAGLSAERCGQQEDAVSAFRLALQRDADLCGARVKLGLLQTRAGHAAVAGSMFEEAIRRDPRCAEGYLNLAVLQRTRGEPAEAMRNVRRALAIDARLLPAFNELALLYLAEAKEHEKKLDLAEVVCSQAQKIDADFAPIYNTWGLIDLRRGDITGAAAKFRRAMSLDHDIFEAHMNFGRVALSFRAYDDAHDAFDRALSLRADSFDALIGLAVAMRGLGKLDAAEARYTRAIELDASRPEPDFNLGVLYQDFRTATRGDMQRARGHFEDFVRKAKQRGGYEDSVADVTRHCKATSGRRRRGRPACLVGRLQTIEQYLEATTAAAL